jgi:hypothetical protein
MVGFRNILRCHLRSHVRLKVLLFMLASKGRYAWVKCKLMSCLQGFRSLVLIQRYFRLVNQLYILTSIELSFK